MNYKKKSTYLLMFVGLISSINYSVAQIKPTSASERFNSVKSKAKLYEESAIQTKFYSIGPSITGGRVVDLEVNSDNPIEFYVAYATGSVWYTCNNGQSFIPVFDSIDVFSIGDIAVKWNKSRDKHIIWVGSGDASSGNASYAGMGIFKSDDGGNNWKWLGLPESQHIGKLLLHPVNPGIAWVAVLGHLHTPNKDRGVYKTNDGGVNWKQVLYINDSTGCVDLCANPLNPDEIYTSAWQRIRKPWVPGNSGNGSGIYKSYDGGENWELITNSYSGFPVGEGLGRIGIAVSYNYPQVVYAVVDNKKIKPSNPSLLKWHEDLEKFRTITVEDFLSIDNNLLDNLLKTTDGLNNFSVAFIKQKVKEGEFPPTVIFDYLYSNPVSHYGTEIYKSNDGGRSWVVTMKPMLSFDEGMGFYFGRIYVSPGNAKKIFVLSASLMVSKDEGRSFYGIGKRNTHADYHAFWINPKNDNHIIVGNDGGVNITYDSGDNWFKVSFPAVGQYYSVTVDNNKPYNVYGGLQDNGTWIGPSTQIEGYGWMNTGVYPHIQVGGGDGINVEVDYGDNNTFYYGIQGGIYSRKELRRVVLESRNLYGSTEAVDSRASLDIASAESEEGSGSSIARIRPRNILGESKLRYNWSAPLLVSKHNQNILYYGSNKFHRSLNKGDKFNTLSGDLTNGYKIGNKDSYATITVMAESPLKFGLLYVGTDDGNIQVSTDGGYTWDLIGSPFVENKSKHKTKITPPRLRTEGLPVSSVTASRYEEGRVYLALNGRSFDNFSHFLFVTENYGKSWREIGSNLPLEPINVICEDPRNDSLIYVGTDGGLYVSYDGGNNFMIWSKGLPRSVPVSDITIQERENEIVLATFGRSLYVAKLDEIQRIANLRK